MREIKFRAWNKPTNKMFYWPNIQEMLASDNMTYHDRRNFLPECNIFQQFTGLQDKNGKEIYEGDIVKRKNRIEVVEYQDSGFTPFANAYFGEDIFDDFEVIGNIYENPELLK